MRVAEEIDLGASVGHIRALAVVQRPPLSSLPRLPLRHYTRVAFERAVLPHHEALLRSALRLAKRRAEAEDLVQETLLRAWRFWPRYREEDNCRGWLQRILNNTFYSQHRAHTRQRAQLAEYAQIEAQRTAYTSAEGSSEPHRLVTHEQLMGSLSALTPGQRRILHLVDVDECSYRETAAALACPMGTVMSRLHRARAALRQQLSRNSCA